MNRSICGEDANFSDAVFRVGVLKGVVRAFTFEKLGGAINHYPGNDMESYSHPTITPWKGHGELFFTCRWNGMHQRGLFLKLLCVDLCVLDALLRLLESYIIGGSNEF
jgi:hypothetical protein